MKRFHKKSLPVTKSNRRGSTLIIVLALLGLLAFTGMFFLTFSSQERAAAEYFSEAAKAAVSETDDPFPWAMEQLIVGANNRQKASIVWSPTNRHSILRNQIGSDLAPHTGTGVHVIYDITTGLPAVDDLDFDGTEDAWTTVLENRLNFVDALAAYGYPSPLSPTGFTEDQVTAGRDYF
ncbi:MAG: hypothetical protein R3C19_19075 [Planctomycetaceae bacterium]